MKGFTIKEEVVLATHGYLKGGRRVALELTISRVLDILSQLVQVMSIRSFETQTYLSGVYGSSHWFSRRPAEDCTVSKRQHKVSYLFWIKHSDGTHPGGGGTMGKLVKRSHARIGLM